MTSNFAELDERILATLARGPLPTSRLAAEVDADEQRVAQRCRALKRARRIIDLSGEDQAILDTLRHNGPLTTPELVKKLPPSVLVGEDMGQRTRRVYERCQRMTNRACLLVGDKVKSQRTLLFFPATGDVLHHGNFAGMQEVVAELRHIARRHGLPPRQQIPPAVKQELRREYRSYLRSLAANASPRERGRIQAFERELFTVLQGTFVSDVVQLVNLRGFRPMVMAWTVTTEACVRIQAGLLFGSPEIWDVVVSSPQPAEAPRPAKSGTLTPDSGAEHVEAA